jgi:hypothetical protein
MYVGLQELRDSRLEYQSLWYVILILTFVLESYGRQGAGHHGERL